MKTPILGQAYVARSVNAANDRMVNLYPEAIPTGGKEPAWLTRCPGLTILVEDLAGGRIRGLCRMGNVLYCVAGKDVYKIDTSWQATNIGTVTDHGGLVSMAHNGDQLFIAANPEGYVYTASTKVLVQITDEDFPGANYVQYLDGYFVFTQPDSQYVWVTAINDGTDINALDFASAGASPDNLVGLIVDHREVWLLGENSVEVWYDSGNADFPLERIQGAFVETGCVSGATIAKMDNSIFWLGKDDRGNGIVYRANGYQPQRISTHAIEFAIGGYSDISDAHAYTYQQEGHAFYVLTFPSGGQTWVFDASTNLWHERAEFGPDGLFRHHRSQCQATFNGKVVVGDYQVGNLYAFDLDNYTDNGAIQKWLRSWRALNTGQNTLKRSIHHKLQLDCESGAITDYTDPQACLRWSNDGGHIWSNERWTSMGKIGETGRRVIWRMLGHTGRTRDRVYEVSGTDPVKIAIMGAELDATITAA